MRLHRHALALILLFLGLFATSAQAARVALVIGNDTYANVARLKNARADAKAMAKVLEASGFRVTLVMDADREAMNEALRRFRASIVGGDETIFSYAGHAVELDGVNYLLPTDIRDDNDERVANDALPLQRVLSGLAQQKPRFSLVIIDACRDNPFEGKTRNVATRGLVPAAAAVKGQMIIYSAGAGQRALDRLRADDPSPNGVFTRVFVREIEKGGQPVHEVVRVVKDEVMRLAESVGHEQMPAIYDQSVGTFYFRRGAGSDPDPKSAARCAADEALWQEAKQLNTLEGYDAYLSECEAGRFAPIARVRKKSLETASAGAAVPPAPVAVPPTAQPAVTVAPSSPTSNEYVDGQTFRECADCPEMVVIPGGSFLMGSPAGKGDDNERPQHRVSVGRFALGKYEVTQGQWRAVMGSNPSRFKGCGDDCPVEKVSWEDAQEYVRRLNEKVGGGAQGPYRPPSEAEWEYGCRGGASPEEYCGGNYADVVAWYNKNSGGTTHRVGTKPGNGYGLHDMTGNVWEWTQDCYQGSYAGAPTDGSAFTGSGCKHRSVRGGSWYNGAESVRSAYRYRYTPAVRDSNLGFRVARTLP